MRPVHVAALGLLLALVAPAGAAARVGVTQHAIIVTLLHEQTFERQRARAQADAQDPCTVAEAWKAGGFAPCAAPDDVLELRRLERSAARRAVSGAPLALRCLLRAQGPRAARRALAAFERGADEADTKVIRPGDAVFAALSA